MDDIKAQTLAYAHELSAAAPVFAPVLEEAEAFWAPDQPLATCLLGALGQAFAGQFSAVSPADRAVVMAHVEDGMADEGDLGIAVATGFIEAMIHRAEADDTWPVVEQGLGPLSRQYADAYRDASRALPDSEPDSGP